MSGQSHYSQLISGINIEQIFMLVDSLVPFDACLHYQILPLALAGKSLTLAMVDRHNVSALNYLRHYLLESSQYSLKLKQIDAQTHQKLVSAYSKYHHLGIEGESSSNNIKDMQVENPQDRATFIIDQPVKPELDEEKNDNLTTDYLLSRSSSSLPILELYTEHLSDPIESISKLHPEQLCQELLGRVLVGGIGRLYFERHPHHGRILWSRDGTLQFVIEPLTPPIFQVVLNELKQLLNLPTTKVQKTKKVEIERCYQKQHLLLRLKIFPSRYGEQATLQILRGKALQFCRQQQQIDSLGKEALHLARQLEQKLKELNYRKGINSTNSDVLIAISQIIDNVGQQLRQIQTR